MNVTTFTPSVQKRSTLPVISPIVSFFFSKPKRILFALVTLAALLGIYFIFFTGHNSNTPITNIVPLSQKFDVVAKTQDGKTTNGKFHVEVTGTYRAPSLLVQGETVTARNGKDFVIVNMEVTNSYNVPLYIQPVDDFRLIGADGKKFAPTAHQGNVEVRPQSTKTSNVGFVVPKSTRKFKVEVGDLNSDKVILEFSL